MSEQLPPPSNAELEILQVLWRDGPQTVRDVHAEIAAQRGSSERTVMRDWRKARLLLGQSLSAEWGDTDVS